MPNESGRRSMAQSFKCAGAGIWDAIKSERNMRLHCCVAVYVIVFAAFMGLSRAEMAVLCLSVGAVISAEIFNTSLEAICDYTQKAQNRYIKVIKDMSAGAVLVSALAALAVGLLIFLRPRLWELVKEIIANPLWLMLLIVSLVIAALFVFIGPEGLADRLRAKRKRGK